MYGLLVRKLSTRERKAFAPRCPASKGCPKLYRRVPVKGSVPCSLQGFLAYRACPGGQSFNKCVSSPATSTGCRLTWMKEKSSSWAGQTSDGGGPSGPSVDSSSELERSTLELRRSLELSRCSTDVDSVYEDK
jgi:hypothetical protein